jgi:DNA-directed RNA polymerase specialized sigma24 family protein
MELDAALSVLLPRKAAHNAEPGRYAVQRYLALNEARTAPRYLLPKELDKYRRAIIQVLLQRRIDHDAAEDLFQELWLQILEDSGVEILADTDRLSRYLYRAACERVLAFRRGELSWVGGHKPSTAELWQVEEPSALEQSLGIRQLAQCARELLFRAPVSPDRKALELLFLQPQPDRDLGRSLNLSEVELVQVVWRTRHQFGEIVRERGVSLGDPEVQHAHEVLRAALYAANALPSKEEERAFELHMMWNPRCAVEVDVWQALKRGMLHVERRREAVACG